MNEKKLIPVESSSTLTGFISGFDWEFKSIKTSEIKNSKKLNYTIEADLKWNLFGFNLFNNSKSFTGTI